MSERACDRCRSWRQIDDGWGVCIRTAVDGDQQPTDETLAYVYGPGVDEECGLLTAARFGCDQFAETQQ